jgi:hypothetical protein
VSDGSQGRFTLFDLDGDILATVPIRPVAVAVDVPGFSVSVAPLELRDDGRFSSGIEVGVSGGVSGRGVPDSSSVPAYLFDAAGAVVDSVGRHPFGGRSSNMIVVDGLVMSVPSVLRSGPLRSPFGGDMILVDRPTARTSSSAEFAVTRLTGSGDTIYRREFQYQAQSVPQAFTDSIVNATMTGGHLAVDIAALASGLKAALGDYAYFPAVADSRIGDDGAVWLQLRNESAEDTPWLVLWPDGSPKGIVRLPRNAAVHWSSGDAVLVAEPDVYGVPWIVRYRLEGPAASPPS